MSDPGTLPTTRAAYWIEWHADSGQHGVWSGPFLEETIAEEQRCIAQRRISSAGSSYQLVVRERDYTEAQFPQLFTERGAVTSDGVLAFNHIKGDDTGACHYCGATTCYVEINYECWLCPGECTARMDAEFNACWEARYGEGKD